MPNAVRHPYPEHGFLIWLGVTKRLLLGQTLAQFLD